MQKVGVGVIHSFFEKSIVFVFCMRDNISRSVHRV